MPTPSQFRAVSAALGLALLLLAGGGPDGAQPRRARSGADRATGVTAASVAEDPDLSTAVSVSTGATLFGLKFKLAGAPLVGKPGSVDLLVVPAGNVSFDHVHMSLRAGEGLRLLSDSTLESDDTVAGEALRYEIRYLPEAARVLTLSVTLVVDAENSSM